MEGSKDILDHSKKAWSNNQMIIFTLLRVAIGWHFLYEGLVKLFTPGWTSAEYLEMSNWIFAPLFQSMAGNPTVLFIVDLLNIWGLILVGLGLILGIFTRLSISMGMALLFLYYVAYPPFVKNDFGMPTEGHYLVVNKTLIEFLALTVLLFVPTGKVFGLDRLISGLFTSKSVAKAVAPSAVKPEKEKGGSFLARRELLKGAATLPLLAAFGYALFKKEEVGELRRTKPCRCNDRCDGQNTQSI